MVSRGARRTPWLAAGTQREVLDTARLQESGLAALEESFLGAVPAATLKQILRDAYPVSLKAGTRVEFNREITAPICLVLDGLLSAYISAHGRQVAVRYNR